MKSLIIWLFLFCFSEVVNAQITWEKYFDSGQLGNYHGNDICLSTNNNIYFVGGGGQGYSKILVIKLNQIGTVLWTKNIQLNSNSDSYGRTIIPTPDDGCIITGDYSKTFLMKLKSNGDLDWVKYYSEKEDYSKINHLEKTSDNKILGCGSINTSSGCLFKTDTLGNFYWKKEFSPSFIKEYYSVVEAQDFGYITISNSSVQNGYELTKYDTSGVQIWSHMYNSGTPDRLYLIDNFLYASGGSGDENGKFLFYDKFDFNGTRITHKKFYISDFEFYTFSYSLTPNNFIFTTYKETGIIGDTTYCIVRKIDSSGNVINQKVIRNLLRGYNLFRNMISVSQNDFIFLGDSKIDLKHAGQLYSIRTDSTLFLKSTVIRDVISSNIYDFQLHQNYPNPFNPSTLIKFSIPKNGFVTFKVYSLTGKGIYSQNKFFNAGTNQFKYTPENLSSGIYFYSLQFGENTQTRKMVFVK